MSNRNRHGHQQAANLREPGSEIRDVAALTRGEHERLRHALRKGISRRDALSMLAAAGLGAAAGSAILASARGALAATPQRGGRVRTAMATHGPSDTLDPQLFTSSIDFTRGRAHYNGLVQLDDNLVPQPELAEEFSANADATEWTFKLRSGVEFHDGSPLTADDVIWSMNRHLGEESVSRAKVLVANVREWVKLDNGTVRAVLDSPNADLPAVLGTHHFKILKEGTSDFQAPVGTGPFMLEDFRPGIRSLHVRNDNYWREGAWLDELELFAITDSTARVNALLAGDVDMISNLDHRAIDIIDSSSDAAVWSVPSGSYPCIVCRTDVGPGADRDFVLALKYLQQRERIVNNVLRGHGTVGNDQPINAAYPEHCRDLAQRPYDPDRARYHLERSGVTQAEIQVAEISSGVTDIVLYLQQEAMQIGLDLQVQRVPTDGYWSAVWMQTPLHVSDWNMRPTANIMLSIAFSPDADWNESHWRSERMGQLLTEARATTDPALKQELHCEMQGMVAEESGVIIPAHKNSVDGLSARVQGMTRNPMGTLGGSEWPEFVWLDQA
jgi:peptide/nickel transport system substrate-binding protein